ncbi:lmo0937 family membrane protein [Myxococcaceae bacterium JPH2]|nr:lmo0937 family membrane protein [Myxococcaceae bacterium JPH2]
MYWTMGIILMVLWVLGMISGSTEGYWVHLLLLFSLVALVLGAASTGRNRGWA